MTVAVIIIAYNEEKMIGNCLASVKRQTVQPDEIIVVDNNSTDRTAIIAREYGARVIEEKNQGMTWARNKGFDSAKSDILVRIDADSQLTPDWIRYVKEDFIDSDIVGVTGPVEFHDFGKWGLPRTILKHLQDIIYFQIARAALGHTVLCGPNMAIRKSAWEKIKHESCNKDRMYHEDTDLTVHIVKIGKIVFDRRLLGHISARTVFRFRKLPDYALRHYNGIKHGRALQKGSNPHTPFS